eukprot:gb/GFBE01039513.1/.p1 GENE.gb/GFBE01039513.1/~~gb/GFBE01039513.1/.p1  ORF type:complete len:1034 (+),score=227.02 gb/GFBE01039513.1/:1-3102(+)
MSFSSGSAPSDPHLTDVVPALRPQPGQVELPPDLPPEVFSSDDEAPPESPPALPPGRLSKASSGASSSSSGFSSGSEQPRQTSVPELRPELKGLLELRANRTPQVDALKSSDDALRASAPLQGHRRLSTGPTSLKEFNESKRRMSFIRRPSTVALNKVVPHDDKASPNRRRMSGVGVEMSEGGTGRRMSMAGGVPPAFFVHAEEAEAKKPRCWRCKEYCAELRARAVPVSRAINRSRSFQAVMFIALLMALFLPDVWILVDRPTNDDLDAMLTVVLCMFLFEFGVQSTALTKTYVGSFFFWMDLLGAVSLLLDLSYIGIMSSLQDSSGVGEQVVIMRAARIAKLGARAGRFTKLVKLLRFLPGMNSGQNDASAGAAKAISGRLIQALSTRVSCLIIIMVMITPLFSMWTFPETDDSLMSWLQRLDDISASRPDVLLRELQKFDAFYADMDYYPFQVSVKTGAALPNRSLEQLPWSTSRSHPVRLDSVQSRVSDNLSIEFNFRAPNQMDSGMNLLLLVFVMILMISFSMVLQNATSKIVLRPLEQLLLQVRQTASTIFESVTDMTQQGDDENQPDDEEEAEDRDTRDAGFSAETSLLDKVVDKLNKLQKKDEAGDASTDNWTGARTTKIVGPETSVSSRRKRPSQEGQEDAALEEVGQIQHKMLQDSGLSLEEVDSWNMNPLEMDKVRNKAAAVYFVGPTNHGIRCEGKATAFMDAAEAGHFRRNPYHSWHHAVDIGHAVWRFSRMCHAAAFLAPHEHFALLVAAVCHDLGHPGVNNAFLVETSHELAMMYNDRSPLENMSCSKLFAMLKKPGCELFGMLSSDQYTQARKVCIDTILHTDNAQHFAMVKDVQMFYEVNSEVLDASREIFHSDEPQEDDDEDNFPTLEALEVYKDPSNKVLLMNLLLHMADISNSTKPFRICRTWAYKVLDEFFRQGDEELNLGIPVQALNDRGKVNRPFSQVGFIEFLVAPLLFTVVKALPPIEPMLEQMMLNVSTWQNTWLSETQPAPSDAEKKALNDRVHKLHRAFQESNAR